MINVSKIKYAQPANGDLWVEKKLFSFKNKNKKCFWFKAGINRGNMPSIIFPFQ